jgi:hypothetical protein
MCFHIFFLRKPIHAVSWDLPLIQKYYAFFARKGGKKFVKNSSNRRVTRDYWFSIICLREKNRQIVGMRFFKLRTKREHSLLFFPRCL